MFKRFLIILLICLPSVVLDQITKYWAVQNLKDSQATLSFFGDLLRMHYAENPGAWGGLGEILPDPLRQLIFTYGVALFLAGLAWYIIKNDHGHSITVGLALVLSGGIGNLIDRARFGYVVDFLYMGYDPIKWLHTNIFNIADVAIMVGAAVLIIQTLIPHKEKAPDSTPEVSETSA